MSESPETPTMDRPGLLRLLWGMIGRPRKTLEILDERGGRTWWLPALLTLALLIALAAVNAPITAHETREALLASQEQSQGAGGMELSSEERDQMVATVTSPLITFVFPAGAGLVLRGVGWLALAGALYLASTVLGGRSTFGSTFCMVIWTWLPHALRTLVQTAYTLISGHTIANQGLSGFAQGHQSIEAAVLNPPSPGRLVLAALLSKVDLYTIWHLVLLATGVIVTSRLPRRKAVLVTLGVWVILTIIGLVPTLIGGLFISQAGFGG